MAYILVYFAFLQRVNAVTFDVRNLRSIYKYMVRYDRYNADVRTNSLLQFSPMSSWEVFSLNAVKLFFQTSIEQAEENSEESGFS